MFLDFSCTSRYLPVIMLFILSYSSIFSWTTEIHSELCLHFFPTTLLQANVFSAVNIQEKKSGKDWTKEFLLLFLQNKCPCVPCSWHNQIHGFLNFCEYPYSLNRGVISLVGSDTKIWFYIQMSAGSPTLNDRYISIVGNFYYLMIEFRFLGPRCDWKLIFDSK